MIIYIASHHSLGDIQFNVIHNQEYAKKQFGLTGRLLSYHYILAAKAEAGLFHYYILKWPIQKDKKMKESKVNLFLDSGAFSAWSKGINIDIKDYINFIKEHEKYLEVYSVLDHIGDSELTLKNQKIMEKAGLSPLPCFHYGSDKKHLQYYVDNYEYIALGGMVPISSKNLTTWLDILFSNFICDKNGIPKVKVHGFGLTSLTLMLRYPWYSVDSTSWVMTSRFGSVYVPKIVKGGKCIYDKDNWKICISGRSPSKTEPGQKHIDTFYSTDRKVILQYFKDKGYSLGKSEFFNRPEGYELGEDESWSSRPYIEYEEDAKGEIIKDKKGRKKIKQKHPGEVEKIIERGLCNDYKLRDEMNIIYFLDLEKSIPEWPWPYKKKSMKGFGM